MSDLDSALGFCDLSVGAPAPKSATIVVFGATGDLTRRKIAPALYNLERSGSLPSGTRMIGFARSELDDDGFRALLREGCASQVRGGSLDEAAWSSLAARVRYLRGDIDDGAAYAALAAMIREPGAPPNALFYLAVAPDRFAMAARMLAAVGLGSAGPHGSAGSDGAASPRVAEGADGPEGPGFRRLVVEKPFGYDLASARALNAALQATFREEDIFRIDHYLGKETVQNLLYFRFANAIFEPLWNRNHIERVEIDVLETAGIGSRGGYYDKAGAARDMLQNHMVQLLCLVAMEPPTYVGRETVRDEKLKVLQALRPMTPADVDRDTVRGRYTAGLVDGEAVASYVDDVGHPGSRTETFVALRAEVQNWRWAGVPFYLRTGKRMDRRASEIVVVFKEPPHSMFPGAEGVTTPNRLHIQVQPDEGMKLHLTAKEPGPGGYRLRPVSLDLSYATAFQVRLPDAYERLLMDVMKGNPTLFMRRDEVEAAWTWTEPILNRWTAAAERPKRYPAGTPGPTAAAMLLERDGRTWQELDQ